MFAVQRSFHASNGWFILPGSVWRVMAMLCLPLLFGSGEITFSYKVLL